jgi:hypothetical protein
VITKEQWDGIELMLSGSFGMVELLIDGYKVTLQIERVKSLKYTIMTYVDGQFCGAWMTKDNVIGLRFYRPASHFGHKAKFRNELIKIYGGKRCTKAKLEEFNKKHTLLDPTWNNVKSMRRHFEKNNKDLSVVKIGY